MYQLILNMIPQGILPRPNVSRKEGEYIVQDKIEIPTSIIDKFEIVK